jgi:hypothetical protein
MLDMCAAAQCANQTHIYNDPMWKVLTLDSNMNNDWGNTQIEQSDGGLNEENDELDEGENGTCEYLELLGGDDM